MLAEIYSVKICDSAVDMAHGNFSNIIEIYLRNKKISFNHADDEFHCFVAHHSRYDEQNATKIGEIEIPKAMIEALSNFIVAKNRLAKTKKWFKRCVARNIEKMSKRKTRKSK